MKFACIGRTLQHSFSAQIHARLGLYPYELCPLPPEALTEFFCRGEYDGFNVTIPYKEAVLPHLAVLSSQAEECGAVNTVLRRDGVWHGYNTDLPAMEALFARGGMKLAGKRVLILGTGGTSRTAMALCRRHGAEAIRVSRTAREGALSYEQAKAVKDVSFLLNTTPCGMYPNNGQMPLSPECFPHLEGIVDVIYNPLKSRLVLEGERCGLPAVGGLYMLVMQAVLSAQLFTGRQDLIERVEPIYRELEQEKKNLVLIGMPSCGKSTLGREMARRLGREWLDSDDEIVKEAQRTVSQIFSQEGEGGFREREAAVIRRLATLQGKVISTGGGAILRRENLDALRENGRIFFLDAPLSILSATEDRPLSSDSERLKRLYEERSELYRKAAEKRIPVGRDVEKNLDAIEKEWK